MGLTLGLGTSLNPFALREADGQVRRTEQIVLIGPLPPEGCAVKWAFSRLEA